MDVASGKQSVLADDAMLGEAAWVQPWSPDGTRLVYAGGKGEAKMGLGITTSPKDAGKADTSGEAFIAVVSADGTARNVVKNKISGGWPSWSPNGDRIAFTQSTTGSQKLAAKQYVTYYSMALWTCDSKGAADRKLTTGALLTKEEAAACSSVYNRTVAQQFLKQYGSRLSASQARNVKSGKMSVDDMGRVAEALYTKDTGKKLKSDKTPPDTTVFSQVMAFVFEALKDVMPDIMPKLARMDLAPVWSADGKRIAVVRGLPMEGTDDQLVVANVTSGREQVIVEHGDVGCVSWSKNGKLVAAELRRLMSSKPDDMNIEAQPGYPEVWLLEPKQ